MEQPTAGVLWDRIVARLDAGLLGWRGRIEGMGQVAAVVARERGRRWTDSEVFEGLVRSVLSNSTDWAKVERVLPELCGVFRDFRIDAYAALTPEAVRQELVPWFKARRAASMSLRKDLTALISAARTLLPLAGQHGSLDRYFASLCEASGGEPAALALALGGLSSPRKIPALGLPLAAEFLKNIGYDVAKPDRHVNRAAGAFGWVAFRKWPDRRGTTPPQAREPELLAVMRAAADFASRLGQRASFADNALWLLCARSGLYLSNEALAALARTPADPAVAVVGAAPDQPAGE